MVLLCEEARAGAEASRGISYLMLVVVKMHCRAVGTGGGGGQLFADQLTLSQSGGTLCPPYYYVLPRPPEFQTFLRPSDALGLWRWHESEWIAVSYI